MFTAMVLFLTPVIILNVIIRPVLRFAIVFVSATVFVLAITIISQASLGETFVAGATYTVVLVVFVSGNGVSGMPEVAVKNAGRNVTVMIAF